MRALAAAVPQPSIAYMLLMLESGWALARGELQVSEGLATEALEVGTAAHEPGAGLTFSVHIWNLRRAQGRSRELAQQSEQFVDLRDSHSAWRAGAATSLIDGDRWDEARELARREDFREVPVDQTWSGAMFIWADVCSRLRLADRAGELYELMRPFPGQFAAQASVVQGSIDHALGALAGTLERYEAAELHFASSAEMAERFGAPLLLARTNAGWARALIARGRPEDLDRARCLLELAEDPADRLGAGGIVREVADCWASLASVTR